MYKRKYIYQLKQKTSKNTYTSNRHYPDTTVQQTLHGNILEEEISSRFGESLQKEQGTIRVFSQNVKGIPQYNNHFKNQRILETFHKHDIDVWGMSEVNIRWNHVKDFQQWHKRLKDFSESPIIAKNKHS